MELRVQSAVENNLKHQTIDMLVSQPVEQAKRWRKNWKNSLFENKKNSHGLDIESQQRSLSWFSIFLKLRIAAGYRIGQVLANSKNGRNTVCYTCKGCGKIWLKNKILDGHLSQWPRLRHSVLVSFSIAFSVKTASLPAFFVPNTQTALIGPIFWKWYSFRIHMGFHIHRNYFEGFMSVDKNLRLHPICGPGSADLIKQLAFWP